jgi:hypothetical protein
VPWRATWHWTAYPLPGMLTAIDAGQYVTIQNDDLIVDDPDLS